MLFHTSLTDPLHNRHRRLFAGKSKRDILFATWISLSFHRGFPTLTENTMRHLFSYLFICLTTLACHGFAAPGIAQAETTGSSSGTTITGRVVDEVDGLPLPGANISVKGTSKGSITGQDGRYRLENVSGATAVIEASYIGYVKSDIPITLSPGKAVIKNIRLKPGVLISEEITVVGELLKGQAKALNQQKNDVNVTNVVASDQIGKFPDSNIGDALKRIPGISVFNDQGEARFGHVRGTEPRFNSVTVNGERIPSAEAENRTIQLDLVPSDMIQTIEVTKALTPDMDADAIGGSINLVTKIPAEERFSLSAGGGLNFLDGTGGERYQFGGTYGNRFADEKLGVLLSLSYDNNDFGSDNIEGEWDAGNDGIEGIKEFQVRKYDVQRIRRSFSGALDYRFNENHILKFNGIYNWRDDFENRYRIKYKDLDEDFATVERETKGGTENDARLEDQRMMSFTLGGEHDFGKLDLDWQASYSKASEDRPNERYINFRAKNQPFTVDISNPEKPFVTVLNPDVSGGISDSEDWKLKELTEEHQYTEDIDKNFGLNFNYAATDALAFKFGGKIRDKKKKRDNDFYEYEPVDEDAFRDEVFANLKNETKDHFLPGDKYKSGVFVSNKFLGGLDLDGDDFDKELVKEGLAGNFDAKEQIKAVYAMATWDISDNTTLLGGARLEHTRNEYDAFKYFADEDSLAAVTGKPSDYTNVLPYVHLRYNVNDQTNIKLAYTHSLARPNYFDLAPYQEIVAEDEEIKLGNPALEPTLSKNVDLMIEHYLSDIGILSAGVFYKSISDFIVTKKEDVDYSGDTFEQFQPVNAGDGTLMGIETAAQFQLPFIPGLGLYLNYTYTHSEIDNFDIKGREGDDLPLPGNPEHTANASIAYENGPFNIRLSGNYHSDFIDAEEGSIGENKWEDRYYDSSFTLDLNGGYRMSDIVRLYFEVSNLTNQPLRFYQGEKQYLAQEEWYDRRFLVGVKADF
ncbi:MAG: TonB-dependent receptor [Prosthecochloris sp.]|nr:TonB-dependent receptor [Prosthecochloris sp.]